MAISFKQFLREGVGNSLSSGMLKQKITDKFGYTAFKDKSSLSFQVLVDGVNRVDFLQQVEALFSDLGARYEPNKGSSSIGAVVIGKYAIGAAPASKQGKRSAGLDNEDTIINNLNAMLKDGPMHVEFRTKGKTFRVEDISKVIEVGRDTAGRKKSDLDLVTTTGRKVPISLKKDNAEMWESADSYWSARAKEYVDKAVASGNITLSGTTIKKITPNIAVKATRKEVESVVFGSDILVNKGAVIYKTFSARDFTVADDGETIIVTASEIYQSVDEVERGKNAVWFLVRNDSSRKGSKIYPGIRVLAVGSSRINKQVVIVK